MNILLIGECYSNNIGDQIVAIASEHILKKIYPGANFVKLDLGGRTHIASNKDNHGSNRNQNSVLFRLRVLLSKLSIIDYLLKKKNVNGLKPYYINSINNAKPSLAVFCGGQLVNDTFVCQIEELSNILLEKNIPIIYNAVGIGTLNTWQSSIFSKVLQLPNVKMVSCRSRADRFSSTLSLTRIVFDSFDPAIFASEIYRIERDKTSEVIGLGIMDSTRFNREELILFWTGIIGKLEERKLKWKLFYTGSPNDYNLAIEVLQRSGLKSFDKYIKKEMYSPLDLLQELKTFRKIISFRLHSHILAFSIGVPSIAIKWDEKINDFFDKIDRSKYVFCISEKQDHIVEALSKIEAFDQSFIAEKKNIIIKTLENTTI